MTNQIQNMSDVLKYYSTVIKDTEVLTCLDIFEFVKRINRKPVCLSQRDSVSYRRKMFRILIFRSYFRRKWVVLVQDKISEYKCY